MSESPKIIKVTSLEEYRSAPKEQLIELTSGAVFRCKRPTPDAVITYMIINETMPKPGEDGKIDNKEFYKFMKDNYNIILREIVIPCVLEPKVAPEDFLIEDVMELSVKLLEMAGLNEVERAARQRFRPEPSSQPS